MAEVRESGLVDNVAVVFPTCPKCGEVISCMEDFFCRHCGEALTPQHTECVSCGFSAIIPDGMVMNYCPMCAAEWPQAQASGGLNTGGKTTVPCD